MNAVPAFKYLSEFGVARKEPPNGDLEGDRSKSSASAPSLEAKIAEAYAKGLEAGKAELRAEFDMKLSREREIFVSRLSAERAAWASQQGAELGTRIESGLAEMVSRISADVSRLLAPFLIEQLKQRAVADLARAIEACLSASSEKALCVSGPDDLLRAMQDALVGLPFSLTLLPNEECDVRATLGQTVLKSGLEAWIAGIRDAIR